MLHLKLDQGLVDEASTLARQIASSIVDYIGKHTTVAIERATRITPARSTRCCWLRIV